MTITLEIQDRLTPDLAARASAMSQARLRPLMGKAAVRCFKSHFRERQQRPNKNNWPKLGFWADCSDATNYQVVADGVVVSVNKLGIRQRLQGGDIHPVRAKMLTIPASPEAYGKRAGEFNNLRFAVLNGHPALVEAERSDIHIGKRGVKHVSSTTGTHVVYWLARSVPQEKDPTAIPDKSTITAAITTALRGYITNLNARREPPQQETA